MIAVFETTVDIRKEHHSKNQEVSKFYIYCDMDGVSYTFPEQLDDVKNPDLELVEIINIIHDVITSEQDESVYLYIKKVANKIYKDNTILVKNFNSIWEN